MGKTGGRKVAHVGLGSLARMRFLGYVWLAAVAFTPASGQDSPVRIGGIVHRNVLTDAEWDVLTDRYDALFDLGDHGTDFPGPIEEFRRRNPSKMALFYENVGGVPTDHRFSRCDAEEDFFFHSTDPASLRVLGTSSGNFVFFFRDGRAVQLFEHYPAPGISEYVVEVAPSPDGPWQTLEVVTEDGGRIYEVHDRDGDDARVYRVLSHLSDGRFVPYSWVATAEPAAQAIAGGWLDGDVFRAIVHASVAPEDPARLVVEFDWDKDYQFGEPGERYFARTSVAHGSGLFYELSGPVPAGASAMLLAYRFVLDGGSGATAPRADESYTTSRYNNRLQYKNGTFLRQPDHPLAETLLLENLDRAIAAGYNGMHLDFLWDTLSQSWTTFAAVAVKERDAEANLPVSMTNLLASIRRDRPNAITMFNGRYVVTQEENYWRFLDVTSGGDMEFLAFGLFDGATEIDWRSLEALTTIWTTAHVEGKRSLALVHETADNHAARLKSLALYLTVTHENAFYYYTTHRIYRSVEYFPEWDVPLGQPTLEVLPAIPWDLRGPKLLSREFENGWVFFNFDAEDSTEIDLGRTYYRLTVTGGVHGALGGDGAAIYEPVRTLRIGPKDGAIVVSDPSEGIPLPPTGLTVR